ncbi:GMC family oxidoreductase [Sphingomonas aerolata]|uniref:GMC family oxidoreductase n=1 Tax=Sphingomonas aerolata TaxID=185951 RepID=UPI002FDF2ADD
MPAACRQPADARRRGRRLWPPQGADRLQLSRQRTGDRSPRPAYAQRHLGGGGAQDIFAVDRSAHTIGTCRMGHDGDTAVVDSDGRSFDIANLLICDNSIFPSALAANPALTIMALSLRTADRFLASDD